MHVLGVEINNSVWTVVHLKKRFQGIDVLGCHYLDGETDYKKAESLKEILKGLDKNSVRLAFGFSRSFSISRVLDIPSPGKEAIDRMLRFELEKHIPFPPAEACYGFQILERKKNIYTIIFEAVRKTTVNELREILDGLDIEPDSILTERAAIYNLLYYLKKIPKDRSASIAWLSEERAVVDTFSGSLPVESISFNKRDSESISKTLTKALRFSSFRQNRLAFDAPLYVFSKNPLEDFYDPGEQDEANNKNRIQISFGELLKDNRYFKSSCEHAEPVALGVALSALGKGFFSINISPVKRKKSIINSRRLCFKLFGLFVGLVAFLLAAYLFNDMSSLRKIEAANSDLENRTQEIKKLKLALNTLDERIGFIEEIDDKSVESLNILKELTALLPDDTWLTSFAYSGDEVAVEGFSRQATVLLLALEKSGFVEEVEFSGPVRKTNEGKEHFNLRARVSKRSGQKK